MPKSFNNYIQTELTRLTETGNLRILPCITHQGNYVVFDGRRMLNLSSNDYLGLSADNELANEFMQSARLNTSFFTSSSSRLLTGTFEAHEELENTLSRLFGTESALIFNCGYMANTGILPAVSAKNTLILADKLVHASMIDGIRLSQGTHIRFNHNDYTQLERLVAQNYEKYERIIVVTESVFSMDGDTADLQKLVQFKHSFPRILLYVDEAHAVGVRGARGLGLAEEQGCIQDIDFLVGTFGKALASAGAYIVCKKEIRDYLVNKMRSFIFTTAMPPVNALWTNFILKKTPFLQPQRARLQKISSQLIDAIREKGYVCVSDSHIVPLIVGDSFKAKKMALDFQQNGFYALPVRPPTVPEGTSRIRFSLNAQLTEEDINRLVSLTPKTQ